MRRFAGLLIGVAVLASCAVAQGNFAVTGTPVPPKLLKQNYGNVPSEIMAYDLSICNVSASKQSVLSTQIYQALSASNGAIRPIGREIMLASMLRNQNRSPLNIASIALSSATEALSIMGSSKFRAPSGLLTGIAFAWMSGQQVMANLKPVLSADQLQNFESRVLENALVLDAGSCVERTMFAAEGTAKPQAQSLSFHVR